jgi:hypothetical protein
VILIGKHSKLVWVLCWPIQQISRIYAYWAASKTASTEVHAPASSWCDVGVKFPFEHITYHAFVLPLHSNIYAWFPVELPRTRAVDLSQRHLSCGVRGLERDVSQLLQCLYFDFRSKVSQYLDSFACLAVCQQLLIGTGTPPTDVELL